MRSMIALPAACLLLACAAPRASGPATAAPIGPDSHADDAPTPYSADEIRDASKPGRTYDFRIEAQGHPTVHHVSTFLTVNDQFAELKRSIVDDNGQDVAPEKITHPTWEELRQHAAFPRSAVTIDEEQATVPAGTFDCLRYTVKESDGSVSVYFFAKAMPGAPVLFYQEKNGARLMTGQLVRYFPGT